MSKFYLYRNGNKTIGIATVDAENEQGLTAYETKAEAKRIRSLINKLEYRFQGIFIGLPDDSIAYEQYCGGHGHFVLNTEEGMTEAYLEYFENPTGNDALSDLLEEYGLYFEWNNPAIATVNPIF
jgi:hypothetical protein